MASTAAGASLTEAHRLAQAQLLAQSLADVVALWPMLDVAALDASFPAYARALSAILAARRDSSTSLASAYLQAYRAAEGVAGSLDVVAAEALADARALTSLLVTGPIAAKVAIRNGKPADLAMNLALAQTAGAAARLVLSGGRETIYRTVRGDSKAQGVQRVTDGHPCAFCAMLAGRGAVYRSEMSADFRAHDKCGCQAEPIYRPNGALPGRAQEFADLWASSTKGASGDAAVAAFRRAYAEKFPAA